MSALKTILCCIATTLLSALARAAVVSVPLDQNFAQAVSALPAGTVAQIGPGSITLNAPITVPSGVTLQGTVDASGNFLSHVAFNLAPPALDAIIIPGNASDVEITQLDLASTLELIKLEDGSHYSNIHIVANQLQFGTNPQGQDLFGINDTKGTDDLEITWNYFHDSPATDRDWQVWNATNSHLDHNFFFNVHDGGHLLEPTLNNTFSWNYGTHIYRMGQEIQGSGQNEQGLICDHDVFYDFLSAYNDTEGMSVCPNFTTGVIVSNGYFRNSLAPGSSFGTMTGGAVGGPNRFGYALESICPGGLFFNNTIVLSSLSAAAIATGENSVANNNVIYGGSNALWGVFASDGSPPGATSSWVLGSGSLANTVNKSLDGAPPPPPNNQAGPAVYFATNLGTTWTPSWEATPSPPAAPSAPATQPAPAIAGLTGVSPASGIVALTWATPLPAGGGIITPISTSGRQAFPAIPVRPGATSASLINVHPGWQIDFTVTSGTLSSAVATVSVGGISTAPYSGSPSLAPAESAAGDVQPSTAPATAPAPTHTIQVFGDGSVQVD